MTNVVDQIASESKRDEAHGLGADEVVISKDAAQMKAQMAKSQKIENCLTPEQAKKPTADFFAGQNKDCRYDHFSMDGGKLDAKMVCKSGGMTINATMAGKFSSDNYQLAMTTKSEGTPGQPMTAHTMSMKMEARRTGECTGKEAS